MIRAVIRHPDRTALACGVAGWFVFAVMEWVR